MKTLVAILGLGGLLAVSSAAAQTPPAHYKLHEINFDMWCQETMHYAPERCDQRLPADNKAYEAYVATVEKYEVPYLQQRRQEQQFDKDILHNDPIDSPQQPDTNPPQ